ncbi:hypothetical protein TNIN_422491 [Trichonephila inaurata madagascariensis]|uniref:Uncharacterized protein n=1 Tax=Trichonephila inaurata madagascariensis TaxID=2747483 RepID=A0A8X6Y391_9ARAC|nr:hypothetical protein TNIN_422491 [Trichonephila inaurata madagascariensis]
MPVVRADVVEGQSIDNRGSIQTTSAFGKHAMGEFKGPNMEMNALRHVCSQEVVTDPHPETYTQSLLYIPNENLVAVESNASSVQTNGQDIKESKRKVTPSLDSLDCENNFILSGSIVECWESNVIPLLNDSDEHVNNLFQTFGINEILPNIAITLKRRENITDLVIIRKTLSFVGGMLLVLWGRRQYVIWIPL